MPTPAGPVSMTRPLDFVTLSSCAFSPLNEAEAPSISGAAPPPRFSSTFSRRSRLVSMARPITTISWSMLNGFSMKS